MPSLIHANVLQALADAERRGEKRVRVIIGLRSPDSLAAVKDALARSGVKTLARESESFVAASLSRDEIQQLGRLTKHVKSIWLDQPVSAAR